MGGDDIRSDGAFRGGIFRVRGFGNVMGIFEKVCYDGDIRVSRKKEVAQ